MRLAFDLDLGLYLKFERTDFAECRSRLADSWCWDGCQFNVMTVYDDDDYELYLIIWTLHWTLH
jgi:hypothetical protein